MNYCFFEYQRLNKDLENIVKKKEITPIATLCLDYFSYKQAKKELEDKLKEISKFDFKSIFITNVTINDQFPQFIKELKRDFDVILVQGGLNKINRFLLEKTQIDYIVDPHSSKDKLKRDFIHHFNSGINHVLGALAKEKNIGIFISLHQFSQKRKNLAKDVGRIEQNIKLAKKYNLPIFTSYIAKTQSQIKNKNEMRFILEFLGADTKQSNIAQNKLDEKINSNRFENSSKFITHGIYEL